MSLTNPNKVITEERLSEFYQSILPYLGGMPDILANKFNKSDLYSTSEKMIGQWIDGKPLYQKTFQTTSPSQVSVSTAVVDLSSSGIDKVVSLNAFIFDTSNITYQGGGSFICWVRYPLSFQNFEIVCQVTNQSYLDDTMLITLQYTKTADSTVSIGNDTDYSTTEKIVGTWIDGKPIYQKTMIPTQQGGLNPNVWTDIGTVGVGTNVVDKVIKLFGVIHNADGNQFFDVPEANMRAEYVKATDIIMVYAQAEWSYRPYFMALQYTKTSD